MCNQKEIIKKCDCYFLSIDKLNSEIPCLNESQLFCATDVYTNFLTKIKEFCAPDCPLECDSMNYQTTANFLQYPSMQYASKFLMNNPVLQSKFRNETITYDLIRQSVLCLNVYYDRFFYSEFSQKPKTSILDLISNIGGIAGVFIGASLLSFLELFEALIEILTIIISKTLVTQNHQLAKNTVTY